MTQYTIFMLIIPILAFILITINILFSKYKPDKAKITPFECGFRGFSEQTRQPMKFVHNLVAVLFLIFDLELILIAPYAVNASIQNHIFELWIFIIFTSLLSIGFIYEYYSNAINIISSK